MDMYTNKRPTMGTSAYTVRAAPVLKGTLVPKSGNAKGAVTPDAGTATRRQGVPQQACCSASYRIVAMQSYTQTDARVQANGRIMPRAMGVNRSFRASGIYGPMA